MSSTLKMVFTLSGSTKTTTLNLAEPAVSLTHSAVNTAAAEIIGKNALKIDGKYPGSLKDAYIQTVTRTELVND